MNARVKLSARQALLGESLTVLPTLALIMVLTIVFSVGTAAVGLLPGDATLAQALTALLTLPAALLTIAPLRLRLQQKHIILALGIAVQRYARAGFYLAAYGDISPVQAISMSVKRCCEEVTELFLFKLSFLPWLLLCAAILPALYVIPYYKQSVTCRFLGGR